MSVQKNLTIYEDVNSILHLLTKGITHIFRTELVVYILMCSLTYDNFNPKSSDIDIME